MKEHDVKFTLAVLTTLMLSGIALATTWVPSEKTDPLTGEKVSSQEIVSYGSYIYNWPSKYDLVFWPLTDEKWICLNPKNGYAAFNDDFEKISDEEKSSLNEWLAENYKQEQPPASHEAKLEWLEKIYRQRKMDDDFWCRFYRLMAYIYQDDENKSISYVKKALPLLEKKFDSKPEGVDKLEVLYLLGEYHRRLGHGEKAEGFLRELKGVKYKDEEGNEKVGHPYFVGLADERREPKAQGSSIKLITIGLGCVLVAGFLIVMWETRRKAANKALYTDGQKGDGKPHGDAVQTDGGELK